MFVQQNGYEWNDVYNPTVGNLFNFNYLVPSSYQFLSNLMFDIFILAVLVWFADSLHPSNHGYSSNPLSFLNPFNWLRKRKNEHKATSSDGLLLQDLCYSYRKYSCMSSSRDVHAVKDVSLNCKQDELIALLGHNGAGKSTLIHVLTGMLYPTKGEASVFGLNLKQDMHEVRKIIGLCPQHDILWDELTAKEHLVLFGKLRGLPESTLNDVIEKKLSDVSLLDERDVLVGTFSGGMKRRLSVILAFLGSPSVVFLDEPTTGMDPQCRRQVWQAIETYKQNKVVVLTTHSMEEADMLSDKVVVMVDGVFSCQGTSLYLKNRYGDGYRITLITKHREQVKSLMKGLMPGIILIDESADSLLFSIRQEHMNDIVNFFQ